MVLGGKNKRPAQLLWDTYTMHNTQDGTRDMSRDKRPKRAGCAGHA